MGHLESEQLVASDLTSCRFLMSVDLQATGYMHLLQGFVPLIGLEGFRRRDASGTFGYSQQT